MTKDTTRQYQRTIDLDDAVALDLQKHISWSIREATRRLRGNDSPVATIWRSLQRLLNSDLAERIIIDPNTYAERHSYQLTDKGKRHVRSLIEAALPIAEQIGTRLRRKLAAIARAVKTKADKAAKASEERTQALIRSYQTGTQTSPQVLPSENQGAARPSTAPPAQQKPTQHHRVAKAIDNTTAYAAFQAAKNQLAGKNHDQHA